MEKMYVAIKEFNGADFWSYGSYKYQKRVDDYFEFENYEDLWFGLCSDSSNVESCNYFEDKYIEQNFDEETAQSFYDGNRDMMTEEIYKELCDDYELKYLVVDVKEEINGLCDDESKPFGYEAPIKKYLLSQKEEERKLIALHYILKNESTWRWADQLADDLKENEVERALYM